MSRIPPSLILLILVSACAILAGCSGIRNGARMQTPAPAGGNLPDLTIISPADGATVTAGDITVSVRVSNFRLVPEYGRPYRAGEGHLHYSMGMGVPAASGSTSTIAPVAFFPTTDTSYTWPDVPPGTYTFSVELANNDHSPFIPPVMRKVTVTVIPAGSTAAPVTTPEEPDTRLCTTDADCVPEQCCQPSGCINEAYKGVCTLLCPYACQGPLDCGAGHCACVNGRCSVVAGPAPLP